jgi:hypothetical protein
VGELEPRAAGVPVDHGLGGAAARRVPVARLECGPQLSQLAQRRIVYLCTNGMFMRKKLKDYLAAIYSTALEPTLARLLSEKLISDKDVQSIRMGKHDGRPVIRPTKWLYWNVHVDGVEYTHDLIVEREGVFRECIEAIRIFQGALTVGEQRFADADALQRAGQTAEARRAFEQLKAEYPDSWIDRGASQRLAQLREQAK